MDNTSIASRQFLALARGEMQVQAPRNPVRVEILTESERYCLGCYGTRKMDVVFGRVTLGGQRMQVAAVCRCCGHAIVHPDLVNVKWSC